MNGTLLFAYFGLAYIMTSAMYMLITRFYDTPFRNAYEQYPKLVEIKNESNHYNEKTFSDMINKSTVNNSSNTKYIGTVNITRNAKFSNGYQQSHSMILDDESKSESIPILEIDNSEVKCSHGATVGKIDKEKVFYLMSRGFNKKESKKILVEGFITDLLK